MDEFSIAERISTVRPVRNIDICAVFHRRELWRNVSQIHKCKPAGGTKEKVMGSPQSLGGSCWRPRMTPQSFMAIHPIVVEIFMSEPKVWMNQPADTELCS